MIKKISVVIILASIITIFVACTSNNQANYPLIGDVSLNKYSIYSDELDNSELNQLATEINNKYNVNLPIADTIKNNLIRVIFDSSNARVTYELLLYNNYKICD